MRAHGGQAGGDAGTGRRAVDLGIGEDADVLGRIGLAVAAVGDTLREQGLSAPAVGGGTTFLQAKTANEVLKAQERRIRLQKLKGELIERARALALVFRLAREERDAWVNWPARAAALMAAELSASCADVTGQQITVEPAAMQKVLEKHVRAHLDELAEVRPDFR